MDTPFPTLQKCSPGAAFQLQGVSGAPHFWVWGSEVRTVGTIRNGASQSIGTHQEKGKECAWVVACQDAAWSQDSPRIHCLSDKAG